MTIIT